MGNGVHTPTEAEPSQGQGGHCLLQVSGAGGVLGSGRLLQQQVVVGCLWAWRGENRGLGAPKDHWHAWLVFPRGMQFGVPTSPAPWGFWLQPGLSSTCTYLCGAGQPFGSLISWACQGAHGKHRAPGLGSSNSDGPGLASAPHARREGTCRWSCVGCEGDQDSKGTTSSAGAGGTNLPQVTWRELGTGSGGVSYLFLNVNGAGVRPGSCVAGETRRHMVKAGAEEAPAAGGMHPRGQTGAAAEGSGEPPLGSLRGGCHARCPPGFRGVGMLVAGREWVPARLQFRQHPPAGGG